MVTCVCGHRHAFTTPSTRRHAAPARRRGRGPLVMRLLPIDATAARGRRALEPLKCSKLLAAMPVQREKWTAARDRHFVRWHKVDACKTPGATSFRRQIALLQDLLSKRALRTPPQMTLRSLSRASLSLPRAPTKSLAPDQTPKFARGSQLSTRQCGTLGRIASLPGEALWYAIVALSQNAVPSRAPQVWLLKE